MMKKRKNQCRNHAHMLACDLVQGDVIFTHGQSHKVDYTTMQGANLGRIAIVCEAGVLLTVPVQSTACVLARLQ